MFSILFVIVNETIIFKFSKMLNNDWITNFEHSFIEILKFYVTSFALKEIDEQYKELLNVENKNINLSICIEIFK